MGGWSDAFKAIIPAIVTVGGGMIANHQLVQQAKGQANDANALAELEYKTALARAEAEALAKENASKAIKPTKSNTVLYIGLGVGGVVLVGLVIFAVTRRN